MERDRHEEEDTQRKELIALLRKFSSVSVGTLLRTRQQFTKLPISCQDDPKDDGYTLFVPIKFTYLPQDTTLLLFDIEIGKVGQYAENATYAARYAGLEQDMSFVNYRDSIYADYYESAYSDDRLRRQILNTVAFHFLTSENDRLTKCHFVLHNQTVDSIRLFFSLFDVVEPGLETGEESCAPVERTSHGPPSS